MTSVLAPWSFSFADSNEASLPKRNCQPDSLGVARNSAHPVPEPGNFQDFPHDLARTLLHSATRSLPRRSVMRHREFVLMLLIAVMLPPAFDVARAADTLCNEASGPFATIEFPGASFLAATGINAQGDIVGRYVAAGVT